MVLDGIADSDGLAVAWNVAQEQARDGDVSLAQGTMTTFRNSMGGGIKEEHQLLNFALRALDGPYFDRIKLHGFSRRDIIEYLEPDMFGLSESWDDLGDQYRKYRDITSKPQAFKGWLYVKKNVTVNTESVRASASEITDASRSELLSLLDRIAE